MLACADVHYLSEIQSVAACLVFTAWEEAVAINAYQATLSKTAPYQPGAFYRRELPPLLLVLNKVAEALDVLVVDGYVWLDGNHRPGLGAYLFHALGGQVKIIGVAKTRWKDDTSSVAVLRGQSRRPLYVTSAGLPLTTASDAIRRMHGPFRIPTLLKQVDVLCRQTVQKVRFL